MENGLPGEINKIMEVNILNLLGIENASSAEFGGNCTPVISKMKVWEQDGQNTPCSYIYYGGRITVTESNGKATVSSLSLFLVFKSLTLLKATVALKAGLMVSLKTSCSLFH